MKIDLVSPYSYSHYGGVNAQIIQLTKEYLKLGHEVNLSGIGNSPVDILNCFKATNGDPSDSYSNLSIRYLGKSIGLPANGSNANIGLSPNGLFKVLVESENADIIHLHEPFAPGPTLMHLLKPKTSPIVATFHRNGVDMLYNAYMKAAKYLRSKIDFSAAVSQSARDTIEKVSGINADLLFNGIDLTEFKTPQISKAKKKTVNILFVGRFEPRKGYDVFLDAIKLLDDKNDFVTFTIVGSGKEFNAQQEIFKQSRNIEWLSNLDRTSLIERYLESDIFVSPATRSESFGLVLLEAMASFNLLLVSKIKPFEALLGEAGLYFNPGDSFDLAMNIRSLIEDTQRINIMKSKALEKVKQYSIENLAKIYIDVYESLMYKHPRPL